MSEPCFDGETYEHPVDHKRLTAQFKRVFSTMSNGGWWSLYDLEKVTGDPVQSISARIRDFRKDKFGGYKVDRRRVTGGTYEYRLDTTVPNATRHVQ